MEDPAKTKTAEEAPAKTKSDDDIAPTSSMSLIFMKLPDKAYIASLWVVAQVFPPFLVAGFGMVAAGLLLGAVSEWQVFQEVPEIMVLVPALLGLKGNLEMTLASRLGTHANLGDMDKPRQRREIIIYNLVAVQCQAIVVGFLASVVAISQGFLAGSEITPSQSLLISASSIAAASVASFVLSLVMILIVIFARCIGVDPDNVSAPIAGMLGDFCTLGLLSVISTVFWSTRDHTWHIQVAGIVAYVIFSGILLRICWNNQYVSDVVRNGWTPVIISMLISSGAGMILEKSVRRYDKLACFAPVMNGAGGNLAAVHSSRLSTDLHASTPAAHQRASQKVKRISTMGAITADIGSMRAGSLREPFTGASSFAIPEGGGSIIFDAPLKRRLSWLDLEQEGAHVYLKDIITVRALCGPGAQARTARMLMLLTIPAAICFTCLIVGKESGWRTFPSATFIIIYEIGAIIQVCLLLMSAHGIIGMLWRRKLDPDNAAIPYVCALGDVIGTTTLTAIFFILTALGGEPWN